MFSSHTGTIKGSVNIKTHLIEEGLAHPEAYVFAIKRNLMANVAFQEYLISQA